MHLPEDVLVDILTRIPILTLREKLIFVCKTWASIILHNPILLKRHALHGEAGLILQDMICNESIAQFHELKEGKFKQRNYKIEFPGKIMGSSGGVALFYNYNYNRKDGGTFHVANPFTGYVMKLPSPPASTFGIFSNISVIPCSGNGNGIVKVVIPGPDSKGKYCWWVLTVGVDISWRSVPSTDHPLNYEKLISVGGVMYSNYCWDTDCCIYAIDLRDEISHFFQFPKELGDRKSWLMEMGEHLCCIVRDLTVHNVWILKDFNQNIWVQLYTIDLHFKESILNYLSPMPIGWLDNNQSLVFSVRKKIWDTTSVIVAYNVKTGKKTTCSEIDPLLCKVQLHKNTLMGFFKGEFVCCAHGTLMSLLGSLFIVSSLVPQLIRSLLVKPCIDSIVDIEDSTD